MNLILIILFFTLIYFRVAYSFGDLSFFKNFVANLVDDKGIESADKAPKEICDENQVMLQLAKLYIISPERVLLLLTSESIQDACKGVLEAIRKINQTQSGCIPLGSENLYMKLLRGVKFFEKTICDESCRIKKKIEKYTDCLPELREEFLDCEGSPDWYENNNQTVCCQKFNDIVNCNYVKTAMMCGLDLAASIREFSTELFQQSLPKKTRCKVSRSLPTVKDPMPNSANRKNRSFLLVVVLTSFIFLIKIIS